MNKFCKSKLLGADLMGQEIISWNF